MNVNAQQGGLGIIPTLFGLQNSNGACAALLGGSGHQAALAEGAGACNYGCLQPRIRPLLHTVAALSERLAKPHC